MLTPEYLGHVGDYLEKVFYDLETEMLCDIAGWLKDNNMTASSTAEYQYWLMKALGVNQKEMNKRIAKVLQTSEEEIERIMNDSVYKSMKADINVCRKAGIIDAGFSFDVSNTVKKHKSGLKQELNNLCDSTAKFANDKMMKTFDKAYLNVSSGLMSYDQAVEQACKDLYKQGIQVVDYESGHVNHVDTAVRVAVRTAVNQNALNCAEELLDELDVNLVETSSHAGARPSHEEWQGKVFWRKHPEGNYRNFYEATGYGTVTGLGGVNCRHNFWPYFPEVGRTSHDDIPKAENNRVYQLEQKQRYQERQIRGWERRRRIKASAGEDITIEKIKLRDWRKKHEQFLKENSDVLKPWQARTKVYGGNELPKRTNNNHKSKNSDTVKVKDASNSRVEIQKAINSVENEDRTLKFERGAVIDDSGNILIRYTGKEHSVEVSDDDLKVMEGKIFTHNHPLGVFFSPNDIKTGFIKTSLGELRASLPNGDTYVLKNNGCTVKLARKFLVEYDQARMKAHRLAQKHIINRVKFGEITLEDYKRNYYKYYREYEDEMLIKMAKEKAQECGLIFEVEHNG